MGFHIALIPTVFVNDRSVFGHIAIARDPMDFRIASQSEGCGEQLGLLLHPPSMDSGCIKSIYKDGDLRTPRIRIIRSRGTLPSSWVIELNSLAHASMVSRLAYIRSRLREQMDKDLVQLGDQIEASKRFRETAVEIKEMADRQRELVRPSEWSARDGRRWEESY